MIFASLAAAQSFQPTIEPEKTWTKYAYCRTWDNHIVQYCDIAVFTTPVSNTNGHYRNNDRPSSKVNTQIDGNWYDVIHTNTGALGYRAVTWKTTRVGQDEQIWVCPWGTVLD